MPKNKRQSPSKHVQQKESKISGKDKIFQSVQDIFEGQLEAEIIHMVLEECDWNVEKAVDNLFPMCETGIQTDPECKNRLAQIAHDVLCSDVSSSDSMSVSSHSSMASSEETNSSRSGMAKSSTNSSRENILNSTEIEGAIGFDPSMIEVESMDKSLTGEHENMKALNQYYADAEAWVSSMDKLGTTVTEKEFKNMTHTTDDMPLQTRGVNLIATQTQEVDVSSPQLLMQDCTPDVVYAKSCHNFSVNVNSKSRTDLDSACNDLSANRLENSDNVVVDMVDCLPGENRTTCEENMETLPNRHSVTHGSNICLKDTLPSISDCSSTILSTDIMHGGQFSATEIEQKDVLVFSAATSNPPFLPLDSDDQKFIPPEKVEYTDKKKNGVLCKEGLDSDVMDSDSQLSPVSGKMTLMELHSQLESHPNSEIFISDDYDKEFLVSLKSDLQNSDGLPNIDIDTDVGNLDNDNKLHDKNFVKFENIRVALNEGNTESINSKDILDLKTFGQEFSGTRSRTSSNELPNSVSSEGLDHFSDKPTIKETPTSEYNITGNLNSVLEDLGQVSSEDINDSDVNISDSSSNSLNESLTRALNDSINHTELLSGIDDVDDYKDVVRSQSCMGSQSEEEVGDELTTALNKLMDSTSPGKNGDIETEKIMSGETPKMELKLHDSDSDEKLSVFCEQNKTDLDVVSMPTRGEESAACTRPLDGFGLPGFSSKLSVNACEFVPKEASCSFDMNMNSDPCKPAPTFLTPKYVSPPKTNIRTVPSSDGNLRFPFSSVTQQTSFGASLSGTAWSTPFRQHSSPGTGSDQVPYSKVGHPPQRIPQKPPPHRLPTAPATKHGDPGISQKGGTHTKLTDIQEVEAKIKAGHKCFVMLRGLPGSGKSTLARKLQHINSKPGVVLSSDDYFIQNGFYKYEPHLLSDAHEWNRLRTIQNLHNGCTPIVVDNTNTQAWEMKPYIKQAQKFGYEISFLEPDTPWKFQPKELARRNNHGVPLHKIRMMLDRYEKGLTVEQVLGKPPRQDGQRKGDQNTVPSHCKDKPSHMKTTDKLRGIHAHTAQPGRRQAYMESVDVKPQSASRQAYTESVDVKPQPGWRQAHTSLVQQYANNLGQTQGHHDQEPSVSTNTLDTKNEREQSQSVPAQSALSSSPVTMEEVCDQSQLSTIQAPSTCGDRNNSNISKEDWKMWEKLGLSDLVKQFSRFDHKNTEEIRSIAEVTSMDLCRALPMDSQIGENQSLGENSEKQTESLTKILGIDQAVDSPREDGTQKTGPVESKTEDTKKSRSPGSHKGGAGGNTKDTSPRSQSSHLRDSSPSSDGTFHTCSEMLTDLEEGSSSLLEDHAVDSQDTSLDLSSTSLRNDEGSDCVTDSDNTAVVDHNPVVVDEVLVLELDTHLTSNNKPATSDFNKSDCDTQKAPESYGDTQKSYVEELDTNLVSGSNSHLAPKGSPDTHQTSLVDLDIKLSPTDDLDTNPTSRNDLDTNPTSTDDLGPNITSTDDLGPNITSTDDLETNQASKDVHDTNIKSKDDLDTNQTFTNDLDTNPTSKDDLETNQTSTDGLDTNTQSTNDLDTNPTSTVDLDPHKISEDIAMGVSELLQKTLKAAILEYSSQGDAELTNLAASKEEMTQDIVLVENITQDSTNVTQPQDVTPCSTTPEVGKDIPQTSSSSHQQVSQSDDVKSSENEDTGAQQEQKYSLDDIPQNVKDTVDELIRDNVGSELNYSVDYSVTANELKAILLFTNLDNVEKMMAEQYITHRLCSHTSKLCTQNSAQKTSDDGTSQPLTVVGDKLSKQLQVYDDFSSEWEEPKAIRKQRLSRRPKPKCKQGVSEVKMDVDKTTKESSTLVTAELENQTLLKTSSTMEHQDVNTWTHPQRQREKRIRNYRTNTSSPPVDDKDQGISTEKARTEPLVTPVAAQALAEEVDDDISQSSRSQSSQESSPTKPAKKKSNRRKLDPYKQGPFLEPEVKNKVTGADWSFPVLPEAVLKEEIHKKKKVQRMVEHETHITARDLKVLNTVNRGEDPVHLMGGRSHYRILTCHNKDIAREVSAVTAEVSNMDKSVVSQHCVDRGTMTEENIEADLDFLQSSFPTIPVDELSDILVQCGNNLEWAINLLLDWKYNLPLSSDDKDKFISRMCQLQKSPTVPKFSFSTQPNSVLRSPSSLLDMCVGYVESQHIAPRQDVEHQIIMSSQQRLNSIEEKIRLKQTYSRTLSQSATHDEDFNETILKELTEQASSDSTSDIWDDKGMSQNQFDISYVESWTADQTNDFTRGPSVESSISGHRSDEEALDFRALQSSTSVMSLQLPREKIQALESLFGEVPHLSGVNKDVVVSLDARTAQALHRCLMLTTHQQTMDREKQMMEDEAYARRLQDEEILTTTRQPPPTFQRPPVSRSLILGEAPPPRPYSTEQGVTSLKDIMVEEMERERKKEEEQKLLEASGNHNVLANRLKRKKLYEQFPGIDESLLDDIYRDNSYNLDNTVLAIRGFLTHDTAPPKNVRTAEASEAYEEKLIAAAKQQSLQEMMDSCLYSPKETKTYQEHEDPDYDDFRAEANIHHRLRHECFQKAQEAYRRGMRDVAAFYSRQGHGHSQKIKEANQRAAEKILQRNSLLKEKSAVDLHGLHVDEAIEALERIIPEREEDLMAYPDKRKQHLVIITGRGNHSKGGIARIRPAVLRFLVAKGYKYSEIYKGCFKVLLKYR